MEFKDMFKTIAQIRWRNLRQKPLWISLLIGTSILLFSELFFEPAIDHYMQGSLSLALGLKVAIATMLKPIEAKIQTETLALGSNKNSDESDSIEADDNWARILIRVYKANKLNGKSECATYTLDTAK
jgi:hypothetical protein